MPKSECNRCGGTIAWCWEEAFAKFGFGDGDGQIETWQVEDVLAEAGYEVRLEEWGMHNTVIASIDKDGEELIPHDRIQFGYDDPRSYLPTAIVRLLDDALPGTPPAYLF